MAVQVWIGEKPEHPQERRAIIALANGLARLEGLYLILANFSVNGSTIDLVIIKADAIFIIELKHCDGKVFGGVNGPWYVESSNGERKRLNPGRKNPYNQVIRYFYGLTNFLNEHRNEFLAAQRAETIDFRTCKRTIVIAPTIQEGSQVETDWRVELRGLDQLPTYLVTERSPSIELSQAEMQAIPELLGCTRWREINDLLDGVMPSWEDTPTDVELPPEPAPPPVPLAVEPVPAAEAPPSRWAAIQAFLRAPLSRAALGLSLLAVILALIAVLRPPRVEFVAADAPSLVEVTSPPDTTDAIGAFLLPQSQCLWAGYQSIAKRPLADQPWETVLLDAMTLANEPLLVITLDEVSTCDGRIRLTWSVRNTTDQLIEIPLNAEQVSLRDSLNNAYTLDESRSSTRILRVEPGESASASVVSPQPVHVNAQVLYVELLGPPLGRVKWLVQLENP